MKITVYLLRAGVRLEKSTLRQNERYHEVALVPPVRLSEANRLKEKVARARREYEQQNAKTVAVHRKLELLEADLRASSCDEAADGGRAQPLA
jgi:hypothetical protein